MDYFELLDEPRKPWLNTESLKEKFLARSIECHPDKFTDPDKKETALEKFTELNVAHENLRDPKNRLAHLLTLEHGEKPPEVHDIPLETADLFIEVGAMLKSVDEFLADQEPKTSPLLKAQAMPKALEHFEKVNGLQMKITTQLESLDREMQNLNESWKTKKPLDLIETIYHKLSYLTRWRDQLQDRAIRLTS